MRKAKVPKEPYDHSCGDPRAVADHLFREHQAARAKIGELLEEIEPWMIGLWRFRIAGTKRQWAVTYCHHGLYYDTLPVPTKQEALETALRTIKRLDKRHGPCPFTDCKNTPAGMTSAYTARKWQGGK